MHKRKIIINNQTYYYHISNKTICIWLPDNTKKIITFTDASKTCSSRRQHISLQITPQIVKDIILNNKSSVDIESIKPHTCPFKVEINFDKSLCRCCKSCTIECAMEI